MNRIARLIGLLLLASLGFIAVSCETDDSPRGPSDNVSGLPWNRPMPGDRTGPMGGMPFQSR